MRKSLLYLLLSILVAVLSSCSMQAFFMGTSTELTIVSSNMNQTYRVFVYEINKYKDNSNAVQVIYVLDGEIDTDYFSDKLAWRVGQNIATRPTMIVGVGYSNGESKRERDYTPVPISTSTAENSGQLSNFYQFLTTELVPYIDSHYTTIDLPERRTLVGVGLGGLAVLYGIFHHQKTFNRFVSASPHLMYGEQIIFKYEADYALTTNDLKANVHLGFGTLESFGQQSCAYELNKKLTNRNYPSLKFNLIPISGAKEFDAKHDIFSNALETIMSNI